MNVVIRVPGDGVEVIQILGSTLLPTMGHLRFPCVQERSGHFDKHTNLIIYNDYSYNELLQVNSILVRAPNQCLRKNPSLPRKKP
jgi:hypothetical protein